MNADPSHELVTLFSDPVVWILLAAYFVPSIIAVLRKSAGLIDCFLCNLFFGWSGLGWAGALFFAIVPPSQRHKANR